MTSTASVPTSRAAAGRRAFAYAPPSSAPDALHCFGPHVQAGRGRFKCRTRLYADSDVCALEVKLRGDGEQTVKLRRPMSARRHGSLDADGRAFLGTCLEEVPPLAPTLRGRHTRVTLVGDGERCTLDLDLAYDGGGALAPGLVIAETKSALGRGIADRALLGLGSRPVPCSKYCLGIALQRRGAQPR